jgi:hypothetical protein
MASSAASARASAPVTLYRTLPACVLGAFLCLVLAFTVPHPGCDFNQFYSSAKLAGTGHLYDWQRLQDLERLNATNLIPFGRLPFYAVVLKPLTVLPYRLAWGVWLGLNAAALISFAVLWPVRNRADLPLVLCWSLPAFFLISTGQDTGLILLVWTLGLLLLESGRDFAAGLVLSLCAAKFHLALGIPVFLIARRKWMTLAGGLVGGMVQLAVSFAAEGWGWPAALRHLASISEFSPAALKMPNLLGLTHALPRAIWFEAALGALVLAAVWLISRRSTLVAGATAAILGGLLVGHHSYVYDCVLFLPALLLARDASLSKPLRYWALVLCTPVPYMLLVNDKLAMIAQVLLNGFALLFLARLAAGRNLRPHPCALPPCKKHPLRNPPQFLRAPPRCSP